MSVEGDSWAHFAALYGITPISTVVTEISSDGRRLVTFVNEAFSRLLGWSPSDVVGLSPEAFTHPDDDYMDRVLTTAQARGEATSYSLDKRYRRTDGTYVWGEVHTTVMPSTDAAGVYQLAQIVDISARKQAETRLQQYEAMQRALASIVEGSLAGRGPEEHYRQLALNLATLVGARDVAICLPTDGGQLHLTAGVGSMVHTFADEVLPVNRRTSAALQAGRPVAFDEAAEALGSTVSRDIGPFIAAPVQTSGRTIAVVAAGRPPGSDAFSDADLQIVDAYCQQLGLALELVDSRDPGRVTSSHPPADRPRLEPQAGRASRNPHEVEAALVKAAGELLAEVGPRVASVRDIARRAAVNQGQIQHYFGGKRQLLRRAIEELMHTHYLAATATTGWSPGLETSGSVQAWQATVRAVLDGDHELATAGISAGWSVMRYRLWQTATELGLPEPTLEMKTLTAKAAALRIGWLMLDNYLLAAIGIDDEHDEEAVRQHISHSVKSILLEIQQPPAELDPSSSAAPPDTYTPA